MQEADFWNYFGVDFERSEFYSPLSLWPPQPSDAQNQSSNAADATATASPPAPSGATSTSLDAWALEWRKRFSPRKYPVIALAEPLAVRREDLWMHRYLHWAPEQDEKVATIVYNYFRVPYLAIHLRNHASHRDACERLRSRSRNETETLGHSQTQLQFGASYQCLGTSLFLCSVAYTYSRLLFSVYSANSITKRVCTAACAVHLCSPFYLLAPLDSTIPECFVRV